jgi:hypothetical protein
VIRQASGRVIPMFVTWFHLTACLTLADGWMPGTSPGMTTLADPDAHLFEILSES